MTQAVGTAVLFINMRNSAKQVSFGKDKNYLTDIISDDFRHLRGVLELAYQLTRLAHKGSSELDCEFVIMVVLTLMVLGSE